MDRGGIRTIPPTTGPTPARLMSTASSGVPGSRSPAHLGLEPLRLEPPRHRYQRQQVEQHQRQAVEDHLEQVAAQSRRTAARCPTAIRRRAKSLGKRRARNRQQGLSRLRSGQCRSFEDRGPAEGYRPRQCQRQGPRRRPTGLDAGRGIAATPPKRRKTKAAPRQADRKPDRNVRQAAPKRPSSGAFDVKRGADVKKYSDRGRSSRVAMQGGGGRAHPGGGGGGRRGGGGGGGRRR